MTGNTLLDLAISLAGIAVLVAISWALGALRRVGVDEAGARDRLAFDEPDFTPAQWFFGRDGRAAAALSPDGAEAAFVFANGDRLATRRLRTGSFNIAADGAAAVARIGDVTMPRIRLAAGDAATAAQWAQRLGGASTGDTQ
jgi:hypothetical protein